MSVLSGITVSENLASSFADAVQSKSTRFIKVSIKNESLIVDLSLPIVGSFKDDLSQLQDDEVLNLHTPAYILAKLDSPNPNWTSIYFVPESAKVREKMLYASTRILLLRSLGSTLFTDSIFATSKADLTAEAYAAHVLHVAAPHPLSSGEQEMIALRSSEQHVVSYSGEERKRSHFGPGVGLSWSKDLRDAVSELGRGVGRVVVMVIDPSNETLDLHFAGETDVNSLHTVFPPSEPCYVLFSLPLSFSSDDKREIVFIYSCPSTSPIKHRMLYSSASISSFQTAKDLWNLQTTVHLYPRRIETSDPVELNEEFLKAELGLKDPMLGEETSRRFARPRGPKRR